MNSQVRTDTTTLLYQAKQLADMQNWSDAADVCRRALELAPGDMEVLDQLGWYLSRAKRYDEAIEVYRDLVRREPDRAKWPYMLGYQYYDQEQWRDAVNWFDRALEFWDTYLVVLYRKGYAHTELKELELAKRTLQKCIAVWRGLEGEERERGAKYYSNACFQLGKILLSSGQSRNAEKVLLEAVRYGPPDAHKHYNLGKALLKNGKTGEALEQFPTADRIEPGKDYILVFVARACIDLARYQQAEAALKRVPVRQRKAYVWHEMGKLHLLQGQPQQALKALSTATKIDPRNHNQYYTLGRAYEACESPAAAHKTYARAIELRQRRYDLEFPEAQECLAAIEQQAIDSGIDLGADNGAPSSPDGFIKTFKADRGFGFISRDNGADVFFHISDVTDPDAIAVGVGVAFDVADSPKGPRATQVSIIQ